MREPLTKLVPSAKGFVSGSLFAASLAPFGLLAQAFLFIIALAVFLDSCMVFGRAHHILSHLLFLVMGLALGLIALLIGQMGAYLILALLLMTAVYLNEYLCHRRKGSR